jgi:hypothetical protein
LQIPAYTATLELCVYSDIPTTYIGLVDLLLQGTNSLGKGHLAKNEVVKQLIQGLKVITEISSLLVNLILRVWLFIASMFPLMGSMICYFLVFFPYVMKPIFFVNEFFTTPLTLYYWMMVHMPSMIY